MFDGKSSDLGCDEFGSLPYAATPRKESCQKPVRLTYSSVNPAMLVRQHAEMLCKTGPLLDGSSSDYLVVEPERAGASWPNPSIAGDQATTNKCSSFITRYIP